MTPIRHDPIFPLPAIPCDHLSVASKLLLRSLIYSSPGQESCRWRPYYKTYVMHCAFCAEAPGSRPWPSSPSDSPSVRRLRFSASSMECCCGRFPIAEPDRIMAIHEVNTKGTWSRLADPNFDEFRDQNHASRRSPKYTDNVASDFWWLRSPHARPVATVSRRLLQSLPGSAFPGTRPHLCRLEKGRCASCACVSYGYWRQYLSSLDRPLAAAPEDRQRGVLGDRRASRQVLLSHPIPRCGCLPILTARSRAEHRTISVPWHGFVMVSASTGASRPQRHRPSHSRHLRRAGRAERRRGCSAAGVAHRHSPLRTVHSAGSCRLSSTRRMRERRQPACWRKPRRERARWPFAVRWEQPKHGWSGNT